jgi:hypothetical protein
MDAAGLAVVIGNVRPETFLSHWREIRDARDTSHDASTTVSRAKKAAKRDGVDLDVLAVMEKLWAMDSDERDLFLRKMIVYFQWLESPLGAFAEGIEAPQAKPAARDQYIAWQTEQDGLAAGKTAGKRDDNPHPPGSPLHVGWDKGWNRGFKSAQRKLAGEMVKTTKGRNAANGADSHTPA